VTVFDKYFERPAAIARHRSAPLAKERERFLTHLETTGTRRSAIRVAATYLLQVVNILGLHRLRDVTLEEVDRAADHWNRLRNQDKQYPTGQSGVRCFAQTARRFLRFEGKLKYPRLPQPFSQYLDDFVESMSSERGLSEATIRGRRYRAGDFLKWYAGRHRGLSGIRLTDIDAYTSRKPLEGRNPVTRHSESGSLRAFFRHAESRGWCQAGTASAIQLPTLRRELFEPQGPVWKDVQRLLDATRGSDPSDLRAKPLLLLFAMYGLRRSEAANLLLTDIDWAANRVTIRRAKRGGLQQFPLSQELATALRRYIENARPRSSCPQVFMTLKAPIGPLVTHTMSEVVRSRMRKLGISSKHSGPQSLRHACATRLLHTGSSFIDIADFLGHPERQRLRQIEHPYAARSCSTGSDRCAMRFSTAIAKYAAWKRVRSVRFARGESALRTLLRSAGDRPLKEVTPKQISTYLDGSRMSAYTWWREYQIIRSFFQFWQSRNELARLPMPRPQAALPPPFRPYIFSRTELIRLLLAIERTPLLDPLTIRTFLLFVYGTGARVHEAISLRVSDIDFQNNLVGLRRTDGGRKRLLPISRTLRNTLDVYLQSSAEQRGQADSVFVTRKGTRVKFSTLRYNFVRICARARIHQEHAFSRTPGMHDLRHTFAVHCLEAWLRQGKDLRQKLPVLSGYLGHVILKSTETYLRLVPGRFLKPLSKLQAPPNRHTRVESHNHDLRSSHFNPARNQM
jgi:integrase/recombinase XerD